MHVFFFACLFFVQAHQESLDAALVSLRGQTEISTVSIAFLLFFLCCFVLEKLWFELKN